MQKSETIPLTALRQLQLEMGFACNIRCVMCFQENYSQRLDPVVWRESLAPIYPRVAHVTLGGGEPTVYKDSWQVLEQILAVNQSVRFGISTNGILFDEPWCDLFIRHGRNINFSINGATREVHEAVNKGSRWDGVMENIARVVEARNATGRDLLIAISMVIVQENVHELTDFLRLGQRLGVNVKFFYDATRLPSGDLKVAEEIARAQAVARETEGVIRIAGLDAFCRHYAARYGGPAQTGGLAQKGGPAAPPPACALPWSAIHVDRLGEVRFCCWSYASLGNLRRQGIEEVWNSRRARLVRRKMAADDFRWCSAACELNPHPTFGLDRVKLAYYISRFSTEFSASPDEAMRKVVRRAGEFARRRRSAP